MRPAALALLFHLLLGLPLAYSQEPVVGSITGLVLDPAGKPLKDAVVSVLVNKEIRALETEIDGVFRFDRIVEGSYLVSVERTGYVRSDKRIILGRGAAGPLEFHLLREAIVAGHIKNENGEPMAGCDVWVTRWDYSQGKRGLVPAGDTKASAYKTGPDGSFAVGGLAPGSYYVVAIPPYQFFDYVMIPNWYQITLYPGATTVSEAVALQVSNGQRISAEMVLHPQPAFRVTVKNPEVRGLRAWISTPFLSDSLWNQIQGRGTADGRIVVSPLPRGEILIDASTTRGQVYERLFVDRDLEIALTAQPGPHPRLSGSGKRSDAIASDLSAEIQGVVRDAEGKPVAGARVAMWKPGPAPADRDPAVTVTTTKADGTYRMKTGFPAGDYVVLASEEAPSPYISTGGPFLFPPFRLEIEDRATPVHIGERGTTATLDPAYVTAAEVFAAEIRVR